MYFQSSEHGLDPVIAGGTHRRLGVFAGSFIRYPVGRRPGRPLRRRAHPELRPPFWPLSA
ncbi:hypothetical protein ACRAWD_15385 [Caulobacter segnis]